MTLNEILDEVRFAGGDICICVEDDVTSLDKYYEGKYFHIDSNWDIVVYRPKHRISNAKFGTF